MTRQVILTFFGRTRYYDATKAEIADALRTQITAAETGVAEAQEAEGKLRDGADKAAADVEKKVEALAKANTGLTEATAAFEASDPDGDSKAHEKLVKALDKATKAVPKAETAVEKAKDKAQAEAEKIAVGASALVAAEARVLEVENQVRIAPRPANVVTALTEPVELGELEQHLPESYHHRQETVPHESPWTMTVPLIVLAGFAIVAGALNLPFTKDLHFLEHWLEPSLFGHEAELTASAGTKWVLALIAFSGALIAIIGSFAVYMRGKFDPAQIESRTLLNAWYVDESYANFMGGPGTRLFDLMAWFDRTIVDGAIRGIARSVELAGGTLRVLQPGFVRSYALGIGLGSVLVMFWFVGRLF
ncbi:MAG: hypothetical protein ACRBK7_29315, partial [Acidimicrobiales bacterium]